MAGFGEDPEQPNPETGKPGTPLRPIAQAFEIGQIEPMIKFIVRHAEEAHRNLYVPLAVLRPDLAPNKKGAENDVIASLGLVPDFDDNDAPKWAERLPVSAPYVLETSKGRFQPFLLFDRPYPPSEAKPVAIRLKAYCRCDHGSVDVSHVWRIPGTLNWPNHKKLAEGRSAEPQLVRIIKPLNGQCGLTLNDLAAALPEPKPEPEPRPKLTPDEPQEPDVSIELIMRLLPSRLRGKITTPGSGDRSKALFSVIKQLGDRDVDAVTIERIIHAHPNGIGAKYVGRTDLAKEIARVLEKPTPPREPLSDQFSEDRLALEFTARHHSDWRFVALWGKWLQWADTHWVIEETLRAFEMARHICRATSILAETAKLARSVASSKTVAGVERLARSDRQHAMTFDLFDAHDWAFNESKMTLDLRTGTAHPHRREDYHTKIAAATADERGPIPLWTKFLDTVTAGDKDLQAYLRRVAGYCMSGVTTEHVLFFLYGTGANGKGVFLNTLHGIWGDFAAVSSMETFIETKYEQHSTDLAMLAGVRLVIAQEVEKNRAWAEAKINRLTGGDPITARYMRQDFFTYTPKFKLMIAGNHKPSLRSVNEAVRRRFHLIPFTVTIPQLSATRIYSKSSSPNGRGYSTARCKAASNGRRSGLLRPRSYGKPARPISPRRI